MVVPLCGNVNYARVYDKVTPGKLMVNSIDLVNYSGLPAENDEQDADVNVAQKIDSIQEGSGIGYANYSNRAFAKRAVRGKRLFGSGKMEPGLASHKNNFNSGKKHTMAHDPAHRLRSNRIHTKVQNL